MNKKIFRSAFYAFGAAALLSGFASCSDDKVDSSVNVDNKVLTEGISSEIDGLYTKFDVTSNSVWSISVEADSTWIAVTDTVGKGNKTVAVNIEPMFGSSTQRTAKIRLRSADTEKVINVVQKPTYKGEAVANDVETTKAIQIASLKGLGCGYSLKGKLLTTCGINPSGGLKALIAQGRGSYDYLNRYNEYGQLTSDGAQIDSVERKSDSLKVSLSFDVSYGAFKLQIKGKYRGNENKVHLNQSYNYAGKYNVANSVIDVVNCIEYYKEARNGSAETVPLYNEKLSIVSPALANLINTLDTLAESESPTAENDFNKAVKSLVNRYGIGIVAEVELGAKLEMTMKYDRDSICDAMHIDSASLATSIGKGCFDLEIGAQADYSKVATTVFDNCAYVYSIEGGSKTAMVTLDKLLSSSRTDGDNLFPKVQQAISDWKQSISAGDSQTLTVTRVGLIKIWELLDPEAADKAKEYILENYKTQLNTLFPDGID